MTAQSPNKLLASLTRQHYSRLLPHLRTVRLANDVPLPHCGATRVYFPGTGLCSITSSMADGALIEIASVGNEGLVGLTTLTGEAIRQHTFLHVGDGTAQWMPLVLFEREFAQEERLRQLVDRFTRVFLESIIQAVACNKLHNLPERCARWLLTTHDRLGRAKFEMGPRTLARVLGVKPVAIEAVVTNFERLGIISQNRQTFTIFDAVGLKRLACDCYESLKRGYTGVNAQTLKTSPLPPHETAKIIRMRPAGDTACMLCGLTAHLPHKSSHECLVALNEEFAQIFRRMQSLRTMRKSLLKQRLSMYRRFLSNSNFA